MISFTANKMVVAQCVADLLLRFGRDCLSITITIRGSSEDSSVQIVTDTSLEDTVKIAVLNFYNQLTCTSSQNTLDG